MEYKIKELAELSGVSTRTLRYYDQIGLLRPMRAAENGYRLYTSQQLDRLQEILFYRELGFSLEEIRDLLDSSVYDREQSMKRHLAALKQRQGQLSLLIHTVEQSLREMKGEIVMSDKEKFEGFKQDLIRKNQEQYGAEVTAKYGKEALEESNRRLINMSEGQWHDQESLNEAIFAFLKEAMDQGDPSCEAAQKAADLHRQWLCMFWKEGLYSKAAHRGMAEMYVADERFREYYDSRLGAGGAAFLQEAILLYTK